MPAPVVVGRDQILAGDDDLRLLAREIVTKVRIMTATQQAPTPAESRQPHREPGITPLVEYARVRNPSGIVSLDDDGEPRLDRDGNPLLSQRGEIISLEY